jgi:hypothetical protein
VERLKPWIKITLAFSLGIALIVFNILWDTVIKDRIDSVEVVVVKPGKTIEKNTKISKNDLILEKRSRSTVIEGVVRAEDMSKVIGLETNQSLVGNEILSIRYLDQEQLQPNPEKGESIRPIPTSWIYASPSTLRRKDRIDLYLMPDQTKEKTGQTNTTNISYNGLSPDQQAKIEIYKDQQAKDNDKYKNEREGIKNAKQNGNVQVPTSVSNQDVKGDPSGTNSFEKLRDQFMQEYNLSTPQWEGLVKNGDIPLLVDIPVIYVKDGSGNEIQNGENSSVEDRLTATGLLSNLEVVLNEDEQRAMIDYIHQGYQLYITYN